MKVSNSTEKLHLQPFSNIAIMPCDTLTLVAGGLPYVNVEENGDIVPLHAGQTLPFTANSLRIFNPFSFNANVWIARDLPINPTYTARDDFQQAAQIRSRSAVLLQIGDALGTGKKRGVAFMAKRGRYLLGVNNAIWADGCEILTFPKASLAFLAAKPAGMLQNTQIVSRLDGTINDQIIGISGFYTEADITAWKTAAGYTTGETRLTHAFPIMDFGAVFSDETAVFFVGQEGTKFSAAFQITELGDLKNDLRV